ncbi:hypothetical protein K7X08_010605 [Anisodus acutangulus]|uniref:Uncharacterized protein n=1 Tax=Anisodus acutangulus TaxID=402998 RepID=A0A9Q1M169_9SOLA|nr:hypothetical protein K7X08_010605 [Anisodus acutangulus]
MPTKVTDTLAAQARKGRIYKGKLWIRNANKWRRVATTTNSFTYARSVKPTILHFQLRNLVWATSKHDMYLISNDSLMHWSSISRNLSEVVNFSGYIVPTEKYAGSLLEDLTQTQISTMAVKNRFLVAGGFQGELICKSLDKTGVSFCARTTYEDNAITNAVEIYESVSGGPRFMAANYDCGVREYDMEKFQQMNHCRFPWPVNHTPMSPVSKLFTVVGDDLDGLLVDSRNGKTVASIVGHFDYSFACAWHPDGRTFSTENQD